MLWSHVPGGDPITYVAVVSTGVLCEQPDLQPMTYYSCPDETVTFISYDQQVQKIKWIVEPYIPASDAIKYGANFGNADLNSPMNRTDYLSARLTNITQRNGSVADMTTSLTVITHGLMNITTIVCESDDKTTSSVLYLAGQNSYISNLTLELL